MALLLGVLGVGINGMRLIKGLRKAWGRIGSAVKRFGVRINGMRLIKGLRKAWGRVPAGSKTRIRGAVNKLRLGHSVVRWYSEEAVYDYADVFLLSFPKCGRTWLRLMIGKSVASHFRIKDVEVLELDQLAAACPQIPLIHVSHDDKPQFKTAQQVEKKKKRYRDKKVLLLTRDPRDVIVSLYFQTVKRSGGYKGDLASFVRRSAGGIDSLISFYNVWYENRHVPAGFLLVRYEDLHESPERELRRVLQFIGVSEIGDETIREAVDYACFDSMRKLETAGVFSAKKLRAGNVQDAESYKTRRGKVNGFYDYLGSAEIAYLNEKIQKGLRPFYGYG